MLSIVIIMWSLPQDLVLISYAAPTEKTEDFESFTMGILHLQVILWILHYLQQINLSWRKMWGC